MLYASILYPYISTLYYHNDIYNRSIFVSVYRMPHLYVHFHDFLVSIHRVRRDYTGIRIEKENLFTSMFTLTNCLNCFCN